jgi:hypothetical protein
MKAENEIIARDRDMIERYRETLARWQRYRTMSFEDVVVEELSPMGGCYGDGENERRVERAARRVLKAAERGDVETAARALLDVGTLIRFGLISPEAKRAIVREELAANRRKKWAKGVENRVALRIAVRNTITAKGTMPAHSISYARNIREKVLAELKELKVEWSPSASAIREVVEELLNEEETG